MEAGMTVMDPIEGSAATARVKIAATPDDKAMLRAAAELPRDLLVARAAVYWPDFLGSALVGYVSLGVAILSPSLPAVLAAYLLAIFSLYRAASFIHELTHIRKGALPGFRAAWNLIIGIPWLIPSFMYTSSRQDALWNGRGPGISAARAYEALVAAVVSWSPRCWRRSRCWVRFAIIAPLSLLIPPLRQYTVEALSGLAINPSYRRRAPEGEFKRMWHWQEAAASLWAIGILVASARYGWRPLLIAMAVFSEHGFGQPVAHAGGASLGE